MCVIQMPKFTENAIKAFLDYLYTCDITKPISNSDTAVEVLEAAHFYEVDALEITLKQVLQEKSTDWFTMEAAFRLYHIARQLEYYNGMKTKAIRILKT